MSLGSTMRRSGWLVHFVVCTITVCTGLHVARGQEPPPAPADTSAYEGYISEALQAYESGRFAEARTLFRRAHELEPTARTLRTMGMCSFNLGDYLDALQNLDAALNEARRPLSAEQREHAADLISRSQVHVGRFKVRLSPLDAELWVDGKPPPRLVSGELLLEPGRHELLAQASGYQAARSTLQVDGGDRTTLEIRLERAPEAPVAAVAPSTSETSRAQPISPTSTGKSDTQAVLGYVALGIGGAGLVGFGITTGLAADKASTLDDQCDDRQCAPAYHDDVDSYDRYKLLSTVTLIGGLAFTATGVILLITDSGETTERASLTPVLGLGAIGVRGRL